MKKQFIFLTAFLIGSLNLINAQDTIVFKNQESKIVKITQIKEGEIICKDIVNLEGSDYIYQLKKIKELHFKNGTVQSYNIPDDEVEYVNDVPMKKQTESKQEESQQEKYKLKGSFEMPAELNKYAARNEYYRGVPYHREYNDPYNPVLAGVASYFIPGLGQMICGETGRGLAFLGGTAGAYIVTMIGAAGLASESGSYYGSYGYSGGENTSLYAALFVGGLLSTSGIAIWSIVDAVHVAKVNNLYNRDLRKAHQASIQLSPFIDASKQTLSYSKQPALGLSLKVNF